MDSRRITWPQLFTVLGAMAAATWGLHTSQANAIEDTIGEFEFGMVAEAWDAQVRDISGDLQRIETKLDKLIAERRFER